MAQEQRIEQNPQSGPESTRQSRGLSRSEPAPLGRNRPGTTGPFSLMRRFSEDMDRLFEGFFSGRDWPGFSQNLSRSLRWPELEVSRKDNRLVVQADMPGMKKEDVRVEVRDNALCISGERRSESERDEGGYYQSERSYGSFCRTVPLPEGAKEDTASATFENGVLRVELEVPPETGGARRIEVR